MNTTELIKPPPPPSAGHRRSATPNASSSDLAPPTAGVLLDEVLPLIGVVGMAGAPVVFVVVPWVLFALILVGPFLLLVIFALAALTFFALTAAILAPPYRLIRRSAHTGHAKRLTACSARSTRSLYERDRPRRATGRAGERLLAALCGPLVQTREVRGTEQKEVSHFRSIPPPPCR